MKEELHKLIDEILIRSVELKIDADLLYPLLQTFGYLSQDEGDLIVTEKTTTRKLLRTFTLLKNKSEDVFLAIQKVCHIQLQTDLLNVVQATLIEFNRNDLIWQPLIQSNTNSNLNKIANKDEIISKNLRTHYKQDLKVIENYWRKFDICGTFDMDTFYNQNIVIKDKYKHLKTTINSFDDLFTSGYKQFIIVADAGYGKSTFVHEMAHQWVKGENLWTKKFSFLFLFRLTEVTQHETQSLQKLLMKCLCGNDSLEIGNLLANSIYMDRTLFIFDGLDELQHSFSEDIENTIFSKGAKLAHVVLTSRPCNKLDELQSSNLYIELNGYTDVGFAEQLKKFNVNPENIRNDLKNILKVPLFNTLFCVTHNDTSIGCLNICIAIEKFVQFAFKRYKKTDEGFSAIEENELLLLLGQSAHSKFSFIKNAKIEYPSVTYKQLSHAINTGLVYQKSSLTDFVFAHQTIAEYCAAYFWFRMNSLKIKEITRHGNVMFLDPEGTCLNHSSLFSRFLCHLNHDYKLFLWKNFEFYVPLLDEYERLPKRVLADNKLSFAYAHGDQMNIMDKIQFSTEENIPVRLFNIHFEAGKTFENVSKIKTLQLLQCSLKLSPGEFFYSYNIRSLFLKECKFKVFDNFYDEQNKCSLVLEYLKIENCDLKAMYFLSYLMSHCTTLKTLKLLKPFEINGEKNVSVFPSSGNDWITELLSNEKLLLSIEHFQFESIGQADLTVLFETLNTMVHLVKLEIWVTDRNMIQSEMNALALTFKNRLKYIEYVELDVKDENGKKVNFKVLEQH